MTCSAMWMLPLLVFAALVAPDDAEYSTRIVGGEPTSISLYPYQVSVERFGVHHCGGSVITPQWILTAGHCISIYPAQVFAVRAGSDIKEAGGMLVRAVATMVHPQFRKDLLDFDVALLQLSTPLTYSAVIKAITLPAEGSEPTASSVATVTGWGFTTAPQWGRPFPPVPSQLHKVSLLITSRDSCNLANNYRVTARMICASAPYKDACQYDSGGPLVDTAGQQLGIVSWGLMGCGHPSFPGVYTHLGHPTIRNFIRDVADV